MGLIGLNNKMLTYNGQLLSFASTPTPVGPAETYFLAVTAAGGTLTDDEKNKISAFVQSCKLTGEWEKMKAIYPMRGDGADSMAINLANPGTFDLTFMNTIPGDFTSGGFQGNGSVYAKTGLIPSVSLGVNSSHLSFYSATDVVGNQTDIGCYNSASQRNNISMRYTGNIFSGHLHNSVISNGAIQTVSLSSQFYAVISRIANDDFRIYRDGVQSGGIASGLVIGVLPNIEIYINSYNNNGALGSASSKLNQFCSIGDGLTPTEASNLSTYVATLNNDR